MPRRGSPGPSVVRGATATITAGVLALALAGCGDDTKSKGDDASGTGDHSSATDGGQPVEVTLLDAGTGHKRAVRLDVEKGHTESSTMTMSTVTDVPEVGQVTIGMEVPMETTVTDVRGPELSVEMVFGDPSLTELAGAPGADEAEVQANLDAMKGLTITETLSKRGEASDVAVEASDELKNGPAGQLLQSMEAQVQAISIPLPQEKVGVGARWEASQVIDLNGLKTDQVATYELKELTAKSFTVDVSTEGTVGGKTTLQGVTVEADGTVSATGSMTGRSGLVLPRRMDSEATTDSEMSADGQHFDTSTTATVSLATR